MKLDIKKLREEKNTTIISSKESLEDIEIIEWSEDVLNGKKKVDISSSTKL